MPKKINKKRRPPKKFLFKKRKCVFCTEKTEDINYKDIARLSKLITERGKMSSRRGSGTCARHQRRVAMAIKQARFIALLPFIRK